MRLISQDGTIDVPYEQVVIQRENNVISFKNRQITGAASCYDLALAEYSTEEKASKAMEMLWQEYMQYAHATNTTNFYTFFIAPKIFKFPQDSEV